MRCIFHTMYVLNFAFDFSVQIIYYVGYWQYKPLDYSPPPIPQKNYLKTTPLSGSDFVDYIIAHYYTHGDGVRCKNAVVTARDAERLFKLLLFGFLFEFAPPR